MLEAPYAKKSRRRLCGGLDWRMRVYPAGTRCVEGESDDSEFRPARGICQTMKSDKSHRFVILNLN
jgi:hypothetical protein